MKHAVLIDSKLYRELEVWAEAIGSVYLVAITEAGLDPAAECRAFEERCGLEKES